MPTSRTRTAIISSVTMVLMVVAAPMAHAQGILPANISPENAIGTVLGSLSSLGALYLLLGTVYNYFARKSGRRQYDGSYIPKF
ncbi:MAG: hypothetical protein Q4A82_07485 [Corynebacterium sp.]|nr:hypothetical protein [Corynebacterium sp.]